MMTPCTAFRPHVHRTVHWLEHADCSVAGAGAASAFLDTGWDWDFVGETANGTEDIWWILEGQDYPRFWWEAQ